MTGKNWVKLLTETIYLLELDFRVFHPEPNILL